MSSPSSTLSSSSSSNSPPPVPQNTLFSAELDDGLTPPSGSTSTSSFSPSEPASYEKKNSYETYDSQSFISDRGTSLTSMSELTAPPPPPPPPPKQNKCSHNRNVDFGCVDVRTYARIMSDNPSVSSGPPVGLDWSFQARDTVDLESYEIDRRLERMDINTFARRGRMNVEDRVRICLESGSTGEEIKACVREVRTIQERMLQNIYGASPFEEVQEKWNSFTEQINMAGIVAAKKFTKLWRKKTKERKEAAMELSEKDEITATAGNTPVKVPGLSSTIVSDTDSSVQRDSNASSTPETNSSSDNRPASSNNISSLEGSNPSPPYPSYSVGQKNACQIKSILKKVSAVPPPPPPPPSKVAFFKSSPKEVEKKTKGDDESIDAEEIKVDLKNFAKSTIKSFKRASKIKFGSTSGEDDSSTFSADMEASMEETEERVSWSTFGNSKKREGGDGQEDAAASKKECTIS